MANLSDEFYALLNKATAFFEGQPDAFKTAESNGAHAAIKDLAPQAERDAEALVNAAVNTIAPGAAKEVDPLVDEFLRTNAPAFVTFLDGKVDAITAAKAKVATP